MHLFKKKKSTQSIENHKRFPQKELFSINLQEDTNIRLFTLCFSVNVFEFQFFLSLKLHCHCSDHRKVVFKEKRKAMNIVAVSSSNMN